MRWDRQEGVRRGKEVRKSERKGGGSGEGRRRSREIEGVRRQRGGEKG